MKKLVAGLFGMLMSSLALATNFSGGGSADGQALGLANKGYDKIVVQKCAENSTWFNCRSTANASQLVKDGEKYFNETMSTIGQYGSVKTPAGQTIFNSTNSCS